MPRKLTLLLSVILICSNMSLAQDPLLANKIKSIIPLLKIVASNQIIFDSISKENSKNKSLELIKKIDDTWKKISRIPKIAHPYLDKKCSTFLNNSKQNYIAEIFVMGNQGEIICLTDRTSDYWQGDEQKWQKTYNNGKGRIFISEPRFDQSTQAFLIQANLPVIDKTGKTIGTITFGIDLDKLQ